MRERRAPKVQRGLALALALVLLPIAAPTAAADELVEVTGTVYHSGLGPNPQPVADVVVDPWLWDGESAWEPVVPIDGSATTGPDGEFNLQLDPTRTYTLRFDAPGDAYPVQFLGGGAGPPLGPDSPSWTEATFIPSEQGELEDVHLTPVHLESIAGEVLGDEDDADLSGFAELFEVTGGGGLLEPVDDAGIDEDGRYIFHDLEVGRAYTVRAIVTSYLPTYLGSTTQPELAASVLLDNQTSSLGEITLRRGSTASGTVTSAGAPASTVEIVAKRWDPAGARWLDVVSFDDSITETGPDGTWSRALETGARYTIYFDTRFGTAISGPLPPSHYLGGGTAPPDPDDPVATFHFSGEGEDVDWALIAPRIDNLSPPQLTGSARIGGELSGTTGTWAVDELTLSRQWLRDGATIPGATGASYVPVAADVGRRLSLRVTASRSGYATATATTPSTAPVARAAATTSLVLSPSSAKFGSAVRATVTVRASAGSPDGLVRLSLDGKVIASKVPAVSGTTGTAVFDLPRGTKVGAHRLLATASQSATVLASSSAASTLRTSKASVRLKVKGPKKWRVKRGKRAKITITVIGTKGGPAPTGKITVKIGKKKVTKALRRGKVTLRAPKVTKRGKATVKISYVPKAKTYTKPKVVKKKLKVR